MKKTLATLFATTALTAAIGLPAWSAALTHQGTEITPVAAVSDDGQEAPSFILARDDDDDKRRRRSRHDKDDEDDDDDDDDEEDHDNRRGSARNPATAGSVAPPQNGLFGNGKAPKVQVN